MSTMEPSSDSVESLLQEQQLLREKETQLKFVRHHLRHEREGIKTCFGRPSPAVSSGSLDSSIELNSSGSSDSSSFIAGIETRVKNTFLEVPLNEDSESSQDKQSLRRSSSHSDISRPSKQSSESLFQLLMPDCRSATEADEQSHTGPDSMAEEQMFDKARILELQRQILLAQIPRDKNGNLASVGSIQHAEGKCSPCAYWFKGVCKYGIDCRYCHFVHEGQKSKRLRPSKQTRQRLKRLQSQADGPEGNQPQDEDNDDEEVQEEQDEVQHVLPAPLDAAFTDQDLLHRLTAALEQRTQTGNLQHEVPSFQSRSEYFATPNAAGLAPRDFRLPQRANLQFQSGASFQRRVQPPLPPPGSGRVVLPDPRVSNPALYGNDFSQQSVPQYVQAYQQQQQQQMNVQISNLRSRIAGLQF